MIELHRINGFAFYLNHKKIEVIENKPDTIIVLENDKKYIVKESVAEIIEKIMTFNRKVMAFQEQFSNETKQLPLQKTEEIS